MGDAIAAPRQDVLAMKLLPLHPLPLDGSLFSDSIRVLGDASVAPTLYDTGGHISAWAEAALDSSPWVRGAAMVGAGRGS
jgi:hypothetical protein